MKRLILFFVLIASFAHAAPWERPVGAYNPTNHSANVTKYQTDSANRVAISSAKVDGDLNKAFQGLNDIEARTPPSVSGNSGKFLSNNGVSAFWAFIDPSPSELVSGTARITVNAADTISFTTNNVTSNYITSGGLLVANTAISATFVSATNISASVFQAGTAAVRSLTISGSIVAAASASTLISGTDTSLYATAAALAASSSLTTPGFYKLPGGLTAQWGTGSIGALNNSVGSATFAVPFTTTCYVSFANMADDGSAAGSQSLNTSCNTTGMSARVGNTTNAGNETSFIWIAIGK